MGATCKVKIWALLSSFASIASSVGYYFPYWLEGYYVIKSGDRITAHFGLFRRCSYFVARDDGSHEIVEGCGRYSAFTDIPSVFWQISTIIIGTGACLSLLLSLSALISLCLSDIVTVLLARAAGVLQLSAGVLIMVGVILYPNGWSSASVMQTCGFKSGIYQLGDCSLNWAFYLTTFGGSTTVMCSVLTCRAHSQKSYMTTNYV